MSTITNNNQEQIPEMTFEPIGEPQFIDDTQEEAIIKVIGVGGGGSNAVNHMHKSGIKGVDFYVCNTDKQALNNSPIKNKIQLGEQGAGGKPEIARKAALEHVDNIRSAFSANTRMVFITACLGGGTGTGASPVIADTIKKIKINDTDIDSILVIAVMTLPFKFEGPKKRQIAIDCIHEVNKIADSVIVINNDKLRTLGNLTLPTAFAMADDVLLTATKSIAELITNNMYVNIDFRDVHSIMQHSGTALMGSAACDGENRAMDVIEAAASSVLLDDQDIRGAKGCLVSITYSEESPITMDEFDALTTYVEQNIATDEECNLIWGTGFDNSLGGQLKVSLVVTGFKNTYDQYCSPAIKKAEGIVENNEIHVPLVEEHKEEKQSRNIENTQFVSNDKSNNPNLAFTTRIENTSQACGVASASQTEYNHNESLQGTSNYHSSEQTSATFGSASTYHINQEVYGQPQSQPTNNTTFPTQQQSVQISQQPQHISIDQPTSTIYIQPNQTPYPTAPTNTFAQPSQQPIYSTSGQATANTIANHGSSTIYSATQVGTTTVENHTRQTIEETQPRYVESPIDYTNMNIQPSPNAESNTISSTRLIIDLDGNTITPCETEKKKDSTTSIYTLSDEQPKQNAATVQGRQINPTPIETIVHTQGYTGIENTAVDEEQKLREHTIWQGRIKTLIDTLRTSPNGVKEIANLTTDQMRNNELYATSHSSESEMSENILDANGKLTENHKVFCNID